MLHNGTPLHFCTLHAHWDSEGDIRIRATPDQNVQRGFT